MNGWWIHLFIWVFSSIVWEWKFFVVVHMMINDEKRKCCSTWYSHLRQGEKNSFQDWKYVFFLIYFLFIFFVISKRMFFPLILSNFILFSFFFLIFVIESNGTYIVQVCVWIRWNVWEFKTKECKRDSK